LLRRHRSCYAIREGTAVSEINNGRDTVRQPIHIRSGPPVGGERFIGGHACLDGDEAGGAAS
jgi:hypothetical protein